MDRPARAYELSNLRKILDGLAEIPQSVDGADFAPELSFVVACPWRSRTHTTDNHKGEGADHNASRDRGSSALLPRFSI